jgi:hypothetical protein
MAMVVAMTTSPRCHPLLLLLLLLNYLPVDLLGQCSCC